MDNSPLARLPAELRNDIYTLALTQPGRIHFPDDLPTTCRCLTTPYIATDEGWEIAPLSPNATALARTCRQIREESTELFYAENVFEFELPWAKESVKGKILVLQNMRKFIVAIGAKNARAVSSITVRFEDIEAARHRAPVSINWIAVEYLSTIASAAKDSPHWHLRILIPTQCLPEPVTQLTNWSSPGPIIANLDAANLANDLHVFSNRLVQVTSKFLGPGLSNQTAVSGLRSTADRVEQWAEVLGARARTLSSGL
ncbi:hypothetical protein LTR08_009084 [Meristemomyces frigidus]|nr:hypothetical protein LTR08_009084 [Meristemomyces frigidus]